jgi:repressor LexA
MEELTDRQRQILAFIENQQARGVSPSYRDIAQHFGFRSVSSVADHLRALQEKGAITSAKYQARSLRSLSPLQLLRKRVVDIPVFGSIPAGFGEEMTQEVEECVSVDIGTIKIRPTARTYALRVRGDSMIGKHILDGDIVVLEYGKEPVPGQVVAALIDGKSTLKTYVMQRNKAYLKAENPRYPDLIPAEELMVQGVFVALIRRSR